MLPEPAAKIQLLWYQMIYLRLVYNMVNQLPVGM